MSATCPKCNKTQHPICSNPKCACRRCIPAGEKAQIYRPMIRGVVVPVWLFNWLWHHLSQPHKLGLYELLECPYCGFRQSHDYWFEREIEAAQEAGILP